MVVGMGLGKVVFRALPRSEVQSLQDGDLCCLAGARALEVVAGNPLRRRPPPVILVFVLEPLS